VTFKPSAQPDAKKPSDLQINWTIQIADTNFDYFTGIGHLPDSVKPSESRTIHDGGREAIMADFRQVVCNGLHCKTRKAWHIDPDVQPTAASVLYCLLMDADAINHPNFESWADCCGYDQDSRAAEKTYRACLENGLKLRRVLGEQGMDDLQEMLQDY
jgi:hypothetical protein